MRKNLNYSWVFNIILIQNSGTEQKVRIIQNLELNKFELSKFHCIYFFSFLLFMNIDSFRIIAYRAMFVTKDIFFLDWYIQFTKWQHIWETRACFIQATLNMPVPAKILSLKLKLLYSYFIRIKQDILQHTEDIFIYILYE